MQEIVLKPGKLIFSEPNKSYTFELLDMANPEQAIVIRTTLITYDKIIATHTKFKNISDIVVANNNVTITNSEGPLNSLDIRGTA